MRYLLSLLFQEQLSAQFNLLDLGPVSLTGLTVAKSAIGISLVVPSTCDEQLSLHFTLSTTDPISSTCSTKSALVFRLCALFKALAIVVS